MGVLLTIIGIAVYLGLVLLTATIARNKGQNVLVWAIFAAILPIIALIAILIVRPRTARPGER